MTPVPAIVLASADRLFTVGGLPLHPLVVHLVVVLLPVAVLGLMAITLRPQWRARYERLVIAGLALAVAAAVLTAKSGEQLALITGISGTHRFWGENLAIVAALLLVVTLLSRGDAALQRSRGRAVLGPALRRAADLFGLVLGAALLVMTVLVGHSGAEAVWPSRVDDAAATPAVSETPSGGEGSLTMESVASHANASSCWTVIDGTVYDVTRWINRHPGGPDVIEALCGIDASAAFARQHGNQSEPNTKLAGYAMGALASS